MTVKEIIEKAIEGGWKQEAWAFYDKGVCFEDDDCLDIEAIVLDPKFWEAVGKTENWYLMKKNGTYLDNTRERMHQCEKIMHQMIDHLCSGGTIESFIATL